MIVIKNDKKESRIFRITKSNLLCITKFIKRTEIINKLKYRQN